jgi:ABC-type transporter MlaC component
MKKYITQFSLISLCFFTILFFSSNVTIAADSKCLNHPAMVQVKQTVDKILVDLETNKSKIKSNPKEVYDIIDRLLVPKADFKVMSQLVLTRNWRKLSKAQKKDFIREFSRLMIRTYGVAFEEYDGETVEYNCPVRKLPGNMDRVEVNTIVHSINRPDSVVKFRLLERNNNCKSCKKTVKSCKRVGEKCKTLQEKLDSSDSVAVKELASCKDDYVSCRQSVDICKEQCDACKKCEQLEANGEITENCSKCDFEWLAYDLIIDNISIIDSYRNIFSDKFRKDSADSIIADMHKKNCKDNYYCS